VPEVTQRCAEAGRVAT